MVGSIKSSNYDGKTRNLFPVLCEGCGQEFHIPAHKEDKCCSLYCRDQVNLKRRVADGSSVEVVCTYCASYFYRAKGKTLRPGYRTYCDKLCQQKHSDLEKSKSGRRKCQHCSSPCGHRTFCKGTACKKEFQSQAYIDRWLRGEETGNTADHLHPYVRAYCLKKAGNKCSECEWSRVHPVTGKVPLTVDHVDGNHKNSTPQNLKVLCPSCHALTPTYGALNKGKGRRTRRKSYFESNPPKTVIKTLRPCGTCGKDVEASKARPRPYCSRDCTLKARKARWPPDEVLTKMLEVMPATEVAGKLGVSSVAVKKWCSKRGIHTHPRGYWAKLRSGKLTPA